MKISLSFYDVKSKSKFDSNEYEVRQKNNRYFAVTKSQSGSHECWRVLSKKQGEELKPRNYLTNYLCLIIVDTN